MQAPKNTNERFRVANDHVWFKRPQPNPQAGIALVCFPHAGGGASAYRDWPKSLPPEVELIVAELPGRESRIKETPLESLEAVIVALCTALSPLLAGRPYAFIGHSLGALVAFELARELRRENHELPFCLFASGREAPTRHEPGRQLHNLPDDEFIQEMISRYDGIPRMLLDEPELLSLLMPAMKADLRLTETYTYEAEAPFTFPLQIMSGKGDTRLTPDLLMPWAEQTTGPAPLTYFDGGHFFIRDSRMEVTAFVSRMLKECAVEGCARNAARADLESAIV